MTRPPDSSRTDAVLGARAAAALAVDVDAVPADLAARAVARALSAPAPVDPLADFVRLGLRFFAASAVTAAVAVVVVGAQTSTSAAPATAESDVWSTWHSAAYQTGSP